MSFVALPRLDQLVARIVQYANVGQLDPSLRTWSAAVFELCVPIVEQYRSNPELVPPSCASLDLLENALESLPADRMTANEQKAWRDLLRQFKRRREIDAIYEEVPDIPKTDPMRRRSRLKRMFSRKSR